MGRRCRGGRARLRESLVSSPPAFAGSCATRSSSTSLSRWPDSSTLMPSSARRSTSARKSRIPAGFDTGRRLVEEQQTWRAQGACGDPQPLPHPVRVAADSIIGASVEIDQLEYPVDPAAGAPVVVVREQTQIAPGAQVRVERGPSRRSASPSRDPLRTVSALRREAAITSAVAQPGSTGGCRCGQASSGRAGARR